MITNDNIHISLLAYRTTPLDNVCTPSELLMGRILRSRLPMTKCALNRKLPYIKIIRSKEEHIKNLSRNQYDSKHKTYKAKELSKLEVGIELLIGMIIKRN